MTGACGDKPPRTLFLSERGQGSAAGETGHSSPPGFLSCSCLLLLEEPKAWEARHGMKQEEQRAGGLRGPRGSLVTRAQ